MQEAIDLTGDSPSPKRQKTSHTMLPKTKKLQEEEDDEDTDAGLKTKAAWKAMESGIMTVN